jgi:hypothetical protein
LLAVYHLQTYADEVHHSVKERIAAMIIRNFISDAPVVSVGPVFPDPPPKLFQGVDTVRGDARNTIVKGAYSVSESATSQLLKVTVDFQSFAESTEINQSASVGLFGASEKINFVKQVERSSWSINMTIRSSYIIGTAEVSNADLDLSEFNFEEPKDRLSFFNRYGDSYISSVTLGSQYLGIFTFHLNSESEHNSTMTSLEAGGLLSAVSFDAGLQTNMSRFFADTKAQVTLSQTAFGVGGVALPAFDDMIEFARKLPELPVISPAVIRSSTTGYETLLPAGSFDAVAKNRDYFVGSGFTKGVYTDRTTIKDQINQLDSIHGIHDTYGYDEPALKTAKQAANDDLAKLDAQIEQYKTRPEDVFVKPALPSVQKGRPGVAFDSNVSDAWGGTGGFPFDDVGRISDFISRRQRIYSLRLHSGDYVRALALQYKNANGETEKEKVHGEQAGTRGQDLFIENGDRIGSITGCSGAYIDQLTIQLSPSGKSAGAGVMRDNLGKIDWSPKEGQTVIGFRGYSGANLDGLQAVWVQFKPTTWKAPF